MKNLSVILIIVLGIIIIAVFFLKNTPGLFINGGIKDKFINIDETQSALIGGDFKLLGGRIQKMQICVEPLPGLLLHIGPPVGGKYLVTAGAKIYMYRALLPANWALGTAMPPVSCLGPPKLSVKGISLASVIPGLPKNQSIGNLGSFVGGLGSSGGIPGPLGGTSPGLSILTSAAGPIGAVITVVNAADFIAGVAGISGINLPGLKLKKKDLTELGPAYPINIIGTSLAP